MFFLSLKFLFDEKSELFCRLLLLLMSIVNIIISSYFCSYFKKSLRKNESVKVFCSIIIFTFFSYSSLKVIGFIFDHDSGIKLIFLFLLIGDNPKAKSDFRNAKSASPI